MLYTNVVRLRLLTSKKKGEKQPDRGRRKDGYLFCTLLLWRCLWTVLFTSKSDRAATCSAPSTEGVKQTQPESVSYLLAIHHS